MVVLLDGLCGIHQFESLGVPEAQIPHEELVTLTMKKTPMKQITMQQ